MAKKDGTSQRRQELLGIAGELFAARGYSQTTVRDVAEQARISSGSLYHHFGSKEEIVHELLTEFLDEVITMHGEVLVSTTDARVQLEMLVRGSFGCLGPHRAAITIYQKEASRLAQLPDFAYLAEAAVKIETTWTDVIERGIQAGQFRAELDPRLVYRFLRDTIWVAARWYRPGGWLDTHAIADQYLVLLLNGFGNHPARHEP